MTERLICTLYWLLQAAALPVVLLYFAHRAATDRNYRARFAERLGFLPPHFHRTVYGSVWLHAVSVGEVISAVEFIRRWRAACPWAPVFVSCGTVAGRALADEKLAGLAEGVFYAPLDYRSAVRRVLRALRPSAVVVMETEIWPNLYREARRSGAALLIVNGRISDRTIARYRRLRWFFRPILERADAILAQSPRDVERYREIGAPAGRLSLGGNLKFDFEPSSEQPPAEVAAFLERVRPEHTWIAASTMPPFSEGDVDEDDVVIEAFQSLRKRYPRLLLILVPRRPARFDTAAAKLEAAGVPFVRRSALSGEGAVLLLDSVGELSSLFGLAGVVFMGGSLACRGGHNILEPAFFGRPIIAGPHMENFAAIAADFVAAGALARIGSPPELAPAVARLLDDARERAALGARARAAAEAQRGATERAVAVLSRLAAVKVPHAPPRPLLWPLTLLWRAGGAVRATVRQQRLHTPVVSVGGLTMGGTGKTPFVIWLAERLKERGAKPAILTRGYRRRISEPVTLLGAGESAPPERTGDEAQAYLRRAVGPVGIGADRARVGRLLEERFQPDVILLDDGFQHRRLARTLDIVLIDALDPFAGGAVPPLGRMREPLSALKRADVLVITRAARGRTFSGLEAELRRANPTAPLFYCRTRPEGWDGAFSGPAAAFCGLANPAAFWDTLAGLGIRPVRTRAFPDHHRYSRAELETLERDARSAGAQTLLTTEKDLANLPGPTTLPLHWLRIGLEVDHAEELLRLIPRG
ncbi:MAG: tetraacyldisaccharide 4'-kinase [Acidobacteria bacterium]|nr:tetraacyldisaccharide 4'-kinase [Acidobacteriota bacterium]